MAHKGKHDGKNGHNKKSPKNLANKKIKKQKPVYRPDSAPADRNDRMRDYFKKNF